MLALKFWQMVSSGPVSIAPCPSLMAPAKLVSGAVHRGIEGNQVENRKSRSHYGISCRETYDTEKHHGQKPHWCPLEEVWKVNGQMSWHIKKVGQIFVYLARDHIASNEITSPGGRDF